MAGRAASRPATGAAEVRRCGTRSGSSSLEQEPRGTLCSIIIIMTSAEEFRELGEAGWRWVRDQVRWDDGPWIPEPPDSAIPGDPENMHSGTGGLAHTLVEIRQLREWEDAEAELADAIALRVRAATATRTTTSYFEGLVSDLGVLIALEADGVEDALVRLLELAQDAGWPEQSSSGLPGITFNDACLGTAGVLLGAVWAGGELGARVATCAADVLLAEAEPTTAGVTWHPLPPRYQQMPELPNWSHGVAGVSAALAVGSAFLGRTDLADAARQGAEHLVSLARVDDGGFAVPHQVPRVSTDEEEFAWGWCHGPAGTSRLFPALATVGVGVLDGRGIEEWHRRCIRSLRRSGIPRRLRPGFWDNDGRCCGTAGVGDVLLDSWQRTGEEDDLAFAIELGQALVERAHRDQHRAYWQFVEHRNEDPKLPPGIGWMQGAAGIAAFLLRLSRVLQEGATAPAVARMDNWWTLPIGVATRHPPSRGTDDGKDRPQACPAA